MNYTSLSPVVKYEIDKELILHIFKYMESDIKEAKARINKEDYGRALTALENIRERISKIKKEINRSTGLQGYMYEEIRKENKYDER